MPPSGKQRKKAKEKEAAARAAQNHGIVGAGTTDASAPPPPPPPVDDSETDEIRPNIKQEAMDELKARVDSLNIDSVSMPGGKGRAGSIGQSIANLRTNYFALSFSAKDKAKNILYRYTLTITPEPKSGRMRRRILYLLLEQHTTVMSRAATDYANLLISLDEYPPNSLTEPWIVDYYSEGEVGPREKREKRANFEYNVFAGNLKRLSLLEMHDLLINPQTASSGGQDLFNPEDVITAINILMSRSANQNASVKQVGRNSFFDTRTRERDRGNLGWGLQVYTGFNLSTRAASGSRNQPGRLLLNINSTASAFYKAKFSTNPVAPSPSYTPMTMHELIKEWSGDSGYDEQRDRVELERFIRGIRVQARHLVRNDRRVYTVFGIADFSGDAQTGPVSSNVTFKLFERDKGKPTDKFVIKTVQAYFGPKYPSVHQDPRALVINCGSRKDKVYLPADVLEVLEGNNYRRLLASEQTRPMVRHACVEPGTNVRRIMDQGRPLLGILDAATPQSPVVRCGFTVESQMLKLTGRRLPSPELQYKDESVKEANTGSGSWNQDRRNFVTAAKVDCWSYINFASPRTKNQQERSDNFVKELKSRMKTYCPPGNYIDPQYKAVDFPISNDGKAEQTLGKHLRSYKNAKVDILFVILPNGSADNYNLLKYVADVKVGIQTICTVKQSVQAVPYLLLKCNLKLGGTNAIVVLDPQTQGVLGPGTMIVGADVTHPGPGAYVDMDSVAAVVASEDASFNRYPVSFRCQVSKLEMIDDFGAMVGERLEHWRTYNTGSQISTTEYPTKLIIYRDGISESQFSQVLEFEWPQIASVINLKYDHVRQPRPSVLLISVQKRHHTRFYQPEGPRNNDHFDKQGNPQPGLIVDTDITYADKYNWFLQSHYCIQGTARPAHYVVLKDNNEDSVDAIQKATHWQCFTFGRCTKSISIHPAARLADLACTRARAYLRNYYVAGNRCNETFSRNGNGAGAWQGRVHPDLAGTMFYI